MRYSMKAIGMQFTVFTLFGSVALSSCQPPEQPAALKEAEESDNNSKVKTLPGDQTKDGDGAKTDGTQKKLEFIGGGALVGTEAMKKAVTECVAKKTFFDRPSSTCTALPLAELGCATEKIKDALSPADYTTMQTALATEGDKGLSGFAIDQCLDCPDPLASPQCKGSTPPTFAGFRVYFVKEVNSSILIRTMYFKSPTAASNTNIPK
jgi:hypothetical protein